MSGVTPVAHASPNGAETTTASTEAISQNEIPQQLKGKKLSWQKLRRYDSLDMESAKVRAHAHHSSTTVYK